MNKDLNISQMQPSLAPITSSDKSSGGDKKLIANKIPQSIA